MLATGCLVFNKNYLRRIWIILTILSSACSFTTDQSKMNSNLVELTVIKRDNQNPGFAFRTDTLINSETVDLTETKIDVYFCWRNFHIPYYLPTNGIYKDSIKYKECAWTKYPANVKCYGYDEKGRVARMNIEGSGTTSFQTFLYDKNDKITSITDNSLSTYKMTYDNKGNLITMTFGDGVLQKRLVFIYKKSKKN